MAGLDRPSLGETAQIPGSSPGMTNRNIALVPRIRLNPPNFDIGQPGARKKLDHRFDLSVLALGFGLDRACTAYVELDRCRFGRIGHFLAVFLGCGRPYINGIADHTGWGFLASATVQHCQVGKA
jgi:hypothetical protein